VTAQPPASVFTSATAKPRPLAYRLHSLFGLKLSLLLAFICLTGTVATVSHEIEWLLHPQVRASEGTARWGKMWEAAQDAHPEGWVRGIGPYDRSDAGYFAKAASVALPDGQEITVLIDPGTGNVTGEQVGVTFHSFMRGLHYYLFTPGDWGFYLVTALGFALLGSLISGLIVYKRFWKGLWRRPRLHRDARTWLGDLHRLGAVWAIPFTLIIAATSIWYLLERDLVTWEPPAPRAEPLRERPSQAAVDRWVATAEAAMPRLRVTGISLPWSDGEPVVVQGQWRAWLVRERTNAAFIDPVSGKLLGLRVAGQLPASERWVHTADPLHFGNFAGLGTKLLWVVFGLALTGLAATGALIHGKRLARPVQSSAMQSWRTSLGFALLPSMILIFVVPAWFYSGWDSGAGTLRSARGQLTVDGQVFALTKDETRWCARPEDRIPFQLKFGLSDGTSHTSEFDAGSFCAELPSSPILLDID
jgi:uncharacterized iron-regulated membrane protein